MLDDAPHNFPMEKDVSPRTKNQVKHYIWIGERLNSLTNIDLSAYLCRNTLCISEDETKTTALFNLYGGTLLESITIKFFVDAIMTKQSEIRFVDFKPSGSSNDHVYKNEQSNCVPVGLAEASVRRVYKNYRDDPIYHLVIDAKGSYVNTALPKPEHETIRAYSNITNLT